MNPTFTPTKGVRLLHYKPPTVEQVISYGGEKGASERYCRGWFSFWLGRGWLAFGTQIDWQLKFSEQWARNRTWPGVERRIEAGNFIGRNRA